MVAYLADGEKSMALVPAGYYPLAKIDDKGGDMTNYVPPGELTSYEGAGPLAKQGPKDMTKYLRGGPLATIETNYHDLAEGRYDAAGTNPFDANPQEKAEGGKLGKYWEGLKRGWDYTTDAIGRGAKAVGRGIESGVGYVGATYKTDSAKRAQDLYETSRTLGEARDAYLAGVLKTKAEIQGYVNQIDEITPGAVDLFTEWL